MLPRELIRKIRHIQIRATRLVDQALAGHWQSAFKGRGIEFEEVRPYQIGDDVQAIDWNVTARAGEPFVKLFREERELSVMLLVDISGSQDFGSHDQSKRELVTELAATLALSAIKSNDRVGLILFSDRIEHMIPPRKGTRHVLRLIRDLLCCEPRGKGTCLQTVLQHLNRTTKRRSLVFLMSDFQDTGYEHAMRIARQKHELVPMAVTDVRECALPPMGLVRLRDPESGQTISLDTSSRHHRQAYQRFRMQAEAARDELFARLQLPSIRIQTGDDYIEPLQRFLARREINAKT